jgi:predicted permease
LVFNVTLPALLFFSTATAPLDRTLDLPLVTIGIAFTLGTVALLWWLGGLRVSGARLAVFVQGAFRGNMAIIGLALALNAYGDQLAGKAAVYLALLTVLYNVVSIALLSQRQKGYLRLLARNPLVVAIAVGMVWSLLDLPLPRTLLDTGEYFATVTLPLALLCIGGSLRWHSFRDNQALVVTAALLKLVVLPVAAVAAGLAAGLRGPDLGLLFFMMAAPTAAASYVMARQMTDQGSMAAEIVAITTAGSLVTVTAGLAALRALALV